MTYLSCFLLFIALLETVCSLVAKPNIPLGPLLDCKSAYDTFLYDVIAPSTITVNDKRHAPCAQVASLAKSFEEKPLAKSTVPAQLAFRCLLSIPFNRTNSLQLLDTITPFLDWQTTLARVKSPPKHYATNVQRPFDFMKMWKCIRSRVTCCGFRSQYDFGMAIYSAFTRVHDGHFSFTSMESAGFFAFGRPLPLVSVSIDGKSPPKPYVYSDILASGLGSKSGANAGFKPSAISQINGRRATEFLEVWAQVAYLQDPDAQYNNLFYSPAQVALGNEGTGTGTFSGGGRGQWLYPGPTTTYKFENGTVSKLQNHARVLTSFKDIRSGVDLAARYLQYDRNATNNVFQEASSAVSASTSLRNLAISPKSRMADTMLPAPGYPKAVHRHSKNWNSGYLLRGDAYKDVAVLAVNSFAGGWGTLQHEFQKVNEDTIASAKAGHRTKLIIDVSANGGGTVLLGYDLITQLFGKALPFGGGRMRAHESLDLLGQTTSQVAANIPRTLSLKPVQLDVVAASWNYRTDADVDYKPFKSWPEKYGPYQLGLVKDKYTSIMRWNLSDPVSPWNGGDIMVSGYLNRSHFTDTPFKKENIIIVYDGYCASTCAVFSEVMHREMGIKSIALGGRSNTRKIQGVGGTKGSSVINTHFIFYRNFVAIFKQAPVNLQTMWKKSAIAKYTALFSWRAYVFRLNARDAFRKGDKTNTPLQFVYELADCRMLYTPAMVIDQSVVWRTVADTVWNKHNACVAGNNKFYVKKATKIYQSVDYTAGEPEESDTAAQDRSAISEDIQIERILDTFGMETRGYPKNEDESPVV